MRLEHDPEDGSSLSSSELTSVHVATILLQEPEAWPHGAEPVYVGDDLVGTTTSAAFGYRVGASVAIATVAASAVDAAVEIDIAGRRFSGRTSTTAVFDAGGRRMRANA